MHTIIYIHTNAFLLHLIRLEKEMKKKRDGAVGKHKLNEMSPEYEVEKVRQAR